MTIQLKGITWNHSRGYVPLVATAQRFMELHPEVEITWDKRSLQAFADEPIEHLAEQYDLLVIDHPWAGFAQSERVLLPLNEYVSEAWLADQAAHSVGKSHESYSFQGFQSAWAIDAATPVSSHRPDLLKQQGLKLPDTWSELLDLARTGLVIIPAIPVDCLMNFYMFCLAHGEEPFQSEEEVVSFDTGAAALESMRELAALCPEQIFKWNPIRVYEAMSSTDDYVYCPFAYGYSNYSRTGYAKHRLQFGDLVTFNGQPLRSTLGGTGIAVSARCAHPEMAANYAVYNANPDIQRTLYVEHGGQPGHRKAWESEDVNRRSRNFFHDTLPALDRAYLRPRYNGYLHFQDQGGDPVRHYMMEGGSARSAWEQLNEFYRQSKAIERRHRATRSERT